MTFFMVTHVYLCLCFASADAEVGQFASAYKEESLNHTSRVLGKYTILELVLLIVVL